MGLDKADGLPDVYLKPVEKSNSLWRPGAVVDGDECEAADPGGEDEVRVSKTIMRSGVRVHPVES
jgi:hypothetical protein